jgi:hypothetical protein
MDTFVYDQYQRALYLRSEHKEVPGNFNSYWSKQCSSRTKRLIVHHNVRVNGKNYDNHGNIPYDGEWKCTPHFGLRIYAQPIGDHDVVTEPSPQDYSHLVSTDRATELQSRIDKEMNIWQGVYDIQHVLANCQWAFPKYFDESELRSIRQQYYDIIEEGKRLIRNLDELHHEAEGRTIVEKVTVSDFLKRLEVLNDITDEYRERVENWPGAGVEYNSIKGWCEYCNDNNIREP